MSSPDLENRHFVAGGTVQAGAGVYIQRAADAILLDLCRKGEFAYVLTSRQMGKSSLMVNAAERLIEDGIRPVLVDLTELGVEITADQWYRGLAEEIAAQLELNTPLGEWWTAREHLGIAQRFTNFLSDVVLKEIPQRIVIFIDEIDTTLRLDFTDDFFASIRYLYNARATDKDLTRISFVLLGVASPSDLIKDRERTPFNIGKRVELGDFQERDAVLGLGVETTLVQGVFHYTGGHPYLTLRVFHSLAERPLTTSLADRIESLFFGEQSKVDSNLQFVRDSLTKVDDRDALLRRYLAVITGKIVADKESDPVCVGLHLSGIVRGVGGFLTERNLIYSRVFDKNWIRDNREINWARRAAWGTAIAAGLLAVLGSILLPAAMTAHKLRKQEAVLNQNLKDEQLKLQQTLELRRIAEDRLKMANQYTDQQKVQYGVMQAELQDLQVQDKALSSQTSDLASQKADLESQKTGLISQLAQLNTQLSRATMEANDAKSDLASLKQLYSSLSRPVTQLSAPVSNANIAHGTLVIYANGTLRIPAKSPRGELPPEVYINGSPYAFVVPETFFTVRLTPGDYTVCVATPFSPCLEAPVNLRNGSTVYLRVAPTLDGTKYQPNLDHTSQAERVKLAPKPIPQDKVIDESMVIRSSN